MILCHCNIITRQEIVEVIRAMLEDEPWQLIVPVKLYHRMGKRGRCCSCFPGIIDLIITTTEDFHRERRSDPELLLPFCQRLASLRMSPTEASVLNGNAEPARQASAVVVPLKTGEDGRIPCQDTEQAIGFSVA